MQSTKKRQGFHFLVKPSSDLLGVMRRIHDLTYRGLGGGPVLITISRLSKSRAQERKYHAMIRDIAKTIPSIKPGMTRDTDVWKALLVHQFKKEMDAMGKPLRKPGRVVLSLDESEAVSIRPSTKEFSVAEGRDFIEFLYWWGTEHEARFRDKCIAIYQEVVQAKEVKHAS